MYIKEIKDAMEDVKQKTGLHCRFAIQTTEDPARAYETYIAATEEEERDCFLYFGSPGGALQRFKDFVEDNSIEVRAGLKREEERLLFMLSLVHEKIKLLED